MPDPIDYDPDQIFDFSNTFEQTVTDPLQVSEVLHVEQHSSIASDSETKAMIAQADAPVTVSYLGEVGALLKDCERIREHAMRRDKQTSELRIFNPFLFEKAVARRQSILSAAVKLHQELWSQHAQHEFFRLVIQTIAQESAPTAHRLIAALRKVNSPVLEVTERIAL